MAFGGLDKKSGGAPMTEINMTPLIDVMLVLLVIFIITAPLFTHAIRLDLPKVSSQAARVTPLTVTVSIDDSGRASFSKTLALHRRIYENNAQVRGVVHTHSTHLVALTLAGVWTKDDVLPSITPYYVMKVGYVPLIAYRKPG